MGVRESLGGQKPAVEGTQATGVVSNGSLSRSLRFKQPTPTKTGEAEVLTNEQAVEAALDAVAEMEGGWADVAGDRGGKTNYGITIGTLQRLRPGSTEDDLRKLTEKDARSLLKTEYITSQGIDKLPPPLIPHIAGLSVNSGPQAAIKLLQRVAGVTPDGRLGPATVQAAQKLDLEKLRQAVEDHYFDIVQRDPSQAKFLKGWVNRVRKLHTTSNTVATTTKVA